MSEVDVPVVRVHGRKRTTLVRSPLTDLDAQRSPDAEFVQLLAPTPDRRPAKLVDLDGRRRRSRTAARTRAVRAVVAGRFITRLTSERTGRPQVFVMDADGSNRRDVPRSRFSDFATDSS